MYWGLDVQSGFDEMQNYLLEWSNGSKSMDSLRGGHERRGTPNRGSDTEGLVSFFSFSLLALFVCFHHKRGWGPGGERGLVGNDEVRMRRVCRALLP